MPGRVLTDEASLDRLVMRLVSARVPKLLVWMCILLFFCQGGLPDGPQDGFQVVEYFCGQGAIGKSCRYGQIRAAMLDLDKGIDMANRKQNPFDLTTEAGFAFLGKKKTLPHGRGNFCIFVYTALLPAAQLRLALWTLLHCQEDALIWLATVCTSFSSMNLGTSKRSPTTPYGDCSRRHVVVGNLLASRSILLIMVATCLRLRWYLEQPGSSIINWYPRFEDLVTMFPCWQAAWWQRHYKSLTPILGLLERRFLSLFEGNSISDFFG